MLGRATVCTARTIEFCEQLQKPHLVIEAGAPQIEEVARQVGEFVQRRGVRRLNIAGPRASAEPKGYDYAHRTIQALVATFL